MSERMLRKWALKVQMPRSAALRQWAHGGHELESGAPVLCDGAAVFIAGLVLENLVVNGVDTFIEVGHDAVVRRNTVLVMAGLEGLNK